MSVDVEHHFETPLFDQRILACSGATASRLDEEFSDVWEKEDADVTFVGADGLMIAVDTKLDPTKKSDCIVLWSSLLSPCWTNAARDWVYVGGAQYLLNQSALVLSCSSILESASDLGHPESFASGYVNGERSLTHTKLEAIHPITKTAYVKLNELPASQITREAIAEILHQFAKLLSLRETANQPPLRLVPLEDSCYLLEWAFIDRRLGFSFETDPKDSGWYYVYSHEFSERYESGTMDQLELNRLIAMTLSP